MNRTLAKHDSGVSKAQTQGVKKPSIADKSFKRQLTSKQKSAIAQYSKGDSVLVEEKKEKLTVANSRKFQDK